MLLVLETDGDSVPEPILQRVHETLEARPAPYSARLERSAEAILVRIFTLQGDAELLFSDLHCPPEQVAGMITRTLDDRGM